MNEYRISIEGRDDIVTADPLESLAKLLYESRFDTRLSITPITSPKFTICEGEVKVVTVFALYYERTRIGEITSI